MRCISVCLLLYVAIPVSAQEKKGPLPEGVLLRLGTTEFRLSTPRPAFSADGRFALQRERQARGLTIYDLHKGKTVKEIPTAGISGALSPDGRLLVVEVGTFTKRELEIWDLEKTEKTHTLSLTSKRLARSLAFAEDGKAILLVSEKQVDKYPLTGGKVTNVLQLPGGNFTPAKFSPAGKYVAQIPEPKGDGTLFIFSTTTGKEVLRLEKEKEQPGLWYGFSSDDRYLVYATAPKTLTLLLLEKGEKKQFTTKHPVAQQLTTFAVSQDGQQLAARADSGAIVRFDIVSGKELTAFESREGSLFYSGELLFAVENSGLIRRWKLKTEKELVVPDGFNGYTEARFSPDGKHLAITDSTGQIELWDLTGKRLRVLGDSPRPRRGSIFEFLNDGKEMLSVSVEGRVKIWDTATGKEVVNYLREELKPAGKFAPLQQAALSPDGKRLAFTLLKDLLVVEARTGKKLLEVSVGEPVWGWVFTPDGKQLVTNRGLGGLFTEPEKLRFVDAETGKPAAEKAELTVLDDPRNKVKPRVAALDFTPDGTQFAMLDTLGNTYLLDRSGKVLHTWSQKGFSVAASFYPGSVTISTDGRWLATGTKKMISVVDLQSGKIVQQLSTGVPDAPAIRFAPDLKSLVVGGDEGMIHLLRLRLGE